MPIDPSSFVRSPMRNFWLGAACFPLGMIAMVLGIMAWRWRDDQLTNTYALVMNLMLGLTMGLIVGATCAPVFPIALRGVPMRSIAGAMLGAIGVALAFVVVIGAFPIGPMGFCLFGAAFLLHSRAAKARSLVTQFCPKCGYDTRGIEADPCPECGIGKFHALELHDQKRFVSKLMGVCLVAVAVMWVCVTVWQWNARFTLD